MLFRLKQVIGIPVAIGLALGMLAIGPFLRRRGL